MKSDKWKKYEFTSFPNITLYFIKEKLSDSVILKYTLEMDLMKIAEKNPRIYHTKSTDCRILPNFLLVKEILSINKKGKLILENVYNHI